MPFPSTDPSEWSLFLGTPGYWRIGRDGRGVWWFLSPAGEATFLNTVTTVQPHQLGRQPPHYVSRDWTGTPDGTDGDLARWASATLDRVRAAGFKGLGAWCHPAFHDPATNPDTPFSRDLNLWAHAPGLRLYDPAWRAAVSQAVQQQCAPLRHSRTLVGYYTDNELDWDALADPRKAFDALPAEDPARRELVAVLRETWTDACAFAGDWSVGESTYAQLDAPGALPDAPEPLARLKSVWMEHLARDYFVLTRDLIRRHDPNHLLLGVRLKGRPQPEVIRASRGIVEAVSINYYAEDLLLDPTWFARLHADSGRPVVVSEYSLHALDGRSGNENQCGFVAQVADQAARAEGYRLLTSRLASVPWVIGADWFQWNDEPPAGRVADGEDVNFGIVDLHDAEYEELVAAVSETTPTLDALHAAGDCQGAWRLDVQSGR